MIESARKTARDSPDLEMPIQTETGSMLTYEDYVKIAEDGLRHEIIEGRHVVSPSPRTKHQVVVGNTHLVLAALGRSGRAVVLLSPIDVQFTQTDVVQPDLLAVARKSVHIIGEQKVDGSPELVVEVLSPTTKRMDRGAKRALYESTGVLEYWIVDPEAQTLTQLSLVDGHFVERVHRAGQIESTAFPGFAFGLSSLF